MVRRYLNRRVRYAVSMTFVRTITTSPDVSVRSIAVDNGMAVSVMYKYCTGHQQEPAEARETYQMSRAT